MEMSKAHVLEFEICVIGSLMKFRDQQGKEYATGIKVAYKFISTVKKKHGKGERSNRNHDIGGSSTEPL